MHSKIKIKKHSKGKSRFLELWDSFWKPPQINCPKCGSVFTEYYDPFFFAPIRTLKGKRRVKCTCCHFVWRQSRTSRTIWDIMNPFL